MTETRSNPGAPAFGRRSDLRQARPAKVAKAKNLMFYVYILKCGNTTEYIGCTNDLKDRIHRHKQGEVSSTKDRLPITVVCYTAFADKYKAYRFEKYLKSGSGRAFLKRHLI
ncbi:MAG: excinuclease ABC C subunit domain-containing protein [Candidatus Daviesbacteria bacterium GW2011_GWB1_41_5]|uniref:Excinuclease ABC C subunit domain-containing protein n=1 Tax=Candidatus Daviesbacteria bacterium GW2011_GWB1_41_5 TaxID=1618429 RepID=A0A0G0WK33_9BACT|nr:MAG: excinuclease ABC C subunit domain-containing protein [Candidatus Daviesbacteria bacterium GW2011_GWB1_41_5]